MRKVITNFLTFFLVISSAYGGQVVVSIAPYKEFVERIAGDSVQVQVMVPAGASAHTFEPNARQVLNASESDLWFRIGESFETEALDALKSHHPDLEVVDLRDGIDMIGVEHTCCGLESKDIHTWLSVRNGKKQAETIAQTLIKKYPEHTARYEGGLQAFLNDLDRVDSEMAGVLSPMKNRTLMVSHPAYAYLCRDYDLQQLPIEFEGKDPSPRQLTNLLKQGKSLGITTIFVQEQHSSKGARLMAEQLGAEVIVLDPYAPQYVENMRHIANSFAGQG